MQSVTSMFDCTHGPKKDCHACLVGEMARALEEAVGLNTIRSWREWLPNARAVLEKANLIEDCVPIEEAEEASRT